MAIYSIRDLEKLSGIKAHTLRVWERRYGILQPKRTQTNIRYYLDEDLQLVLNIALLNKGGLKISKIAKMTVQEIAIEVGMILEDNPDNEIQVEAMTLAMLELDEIKFDRILEVRTQRDGFKKTMLQLIYPFLEKLSLLWLTGSIKPVHENFVTHLIRRKLMVAINDIPLSRSRHNKQFFLYLPPGEKQELSLLSIHYLLRKEEYSVVYLGNNTSIVDVKDAYEIKHPNFIFTIITETFTKVPVQQYVDSLVTNFPESQILLTGYQIAAQDVKAAENVSLFYSLGEFLVFLEELKSN
ncbi:MAG: DNA-binding transcriptional MerR regulator [Paraglaciecola sp.]|jgi:DNA-binding transcriptional MerR regulator